MNPWVYLGVVLMWGASLAGMGWWQNLAGHATERLKWEERLNEEVKEAAAQTKSLQDEYRAKEESWASKLTSVSADYERKLKNANDKFKGTSIGISNGSIGLFDRHATPVCPGPDPAPEAAPSSSGRDAATGCKLSPEAAKFLWYLAGDADRTAQQLAACQQIIIKERE